MYCRKGGDTAGWIRAGFDVTGVDIEDHSDGFPGYFIQGDAIEVLKDCGHEFDAFAAGPPCQRDCMLTAGTNAGKFTYPDLLEPTRKALLATGKPFVIEQPPGRATRRMRVDLKLCGLMFGLPVLRDRQFEIEGFTAPQPRHPTHRGHLTAGWRHGCLRTFEPSVCPKHGGWCRATVYGVYGKGGGKPTVEQAQRALGIDWMTDIKDLNEAVPPAYGEYIGRSLMAAVLQPALVAA